MQGPSLELEMRLKDQKVQVGMDALAAKEEKVSSGLSKISKEAKAADADLAKFAKRTTEVNATPLEKYQTTLGKLDSALKKNLITQETYSRAVEHHKGKLEGANAGSVKLADGVGALATRYLAAGAAIGIATEALRSHQETQNKAVASLLGKNEGRQALLQEMVGAKPADIQNAVDYADRFAKETGADPNQTYKVLATAKREGFEGDFPSIMRARQLVDPEKYAQFADSVGDIFGQSGAQKAMNQLLATRAGAPIEDIMANIPRAGEGLAKTGTTANEAMALMGALNPEFKSGKAEASLLGELGYKLATAEDSNLRGKGVMGALPGLAKMNEADRNKFLGSDKQQILYDLLQSKQGDIASRIAAGEAGVDLVGQTLRSAGEVKQFRSAKNIEMSERKLKQADEDKYATTAGDKLSGRNEYLARLTEGGNNWLAVRGASAAMWGTNLLGGGMESQLKAGQFAAETLRSSPLHVTDTDGIGTMKEAAQEQVNAAKAMNRAAQALERATNSSRGYMSATQQGS